MVSRWLVQKWCLCISLPVGGEWLEPISAALLGMYSCHLVSFDCLPTVAQGLDLSANLKYVSLQVANSNGELDCPALGAQLNREGPSMAPIA